MKYLLYTYFQTPFTIVYYNELYTIIKGVFMDNETTDKEVKTSSVKKMLFALILLILVLGIVFWDMSKGNGYIKQAFKNIKENVTVANKTSDGSEKSISETQDDNISAVTKDDDENIIKFESSSKSLFRIMDKGFIQCSKDGVKYYNDINNQKWNSTFTMVTPVMVGEGNYTAAADTSGKIVKVYDDNGEIYSCQIDGDIIRISLNQNGYLVVLSYMNPDYRIQVFDNKGQEITKREEKSEGVYPLDVDISDDNRVMAVSYADTSDVEVVGKILFFYTYKEDGKGYADAMFSAVQKDDEFITEVEYMDGNKLICIGDRNIYAFDLWGNELWTKPITNKISFAKFSGKQKVVLAYGETHSNVEGEEAGTVEWINLSGRTEAKYSTGENINYMSVGKNAAIVGSYNKFTGISDQGKQLWEYKSPQDLSDMLFINGNDTVMCVGKTSARIVTVKKDSK